MFLLQNRNAVRIAFGVFLRILAQENLGEYAIPVPFPAINLAPSGNDPDPLKKGQRRRMVELNLNQC